VTELKNINAALKTIGRKPANYARQKREWALNRNAPVLSKLQIWHIRNTKAKFLRAKRRIVKKITNLRK
jgi:hypothetical protein